MAVKVGYGKIDNIPKVDDVSEERKEEVKRIFEKKDVYIPPNRIDELLNEFDCVVVHSFGDWNDDYHLSEEERQKNNSYYSAFNNLRRMKKIYRKIKDYIIAVRETFHVIDIVAETNGVYDKEEFLKMYYNGDIEIGGVRFPKYKGKDRKKLNWEYLTDFILSDQDPSEFITQGMEGLDDFAEGLSFEEKRARYFSDKEWEDIQTPLSDKETKFEIELFDVNKDEQGNTNTVVDIDASETKKLIKKSPELAYMIKDIRKRKKLLDNLKSAKGFGYNDSIYADIQALEEYDQKYEYHSKDDIPEFHGDLLKEKDYYKYMEKLQSYEDSHKKVNVNGKLRTIEEARDIELKIMMENAGWNIMAFASNQEAKNKLKKGIEDVKKKQKRVKERLIALKERRDRKNRTMEDSNKLDAEIKKLKKKKSSSRKRVDKLEKKLRSKRKEEKETKKKQTREIVKRKERRDLMKTAERDIENELLSNFRPEQDFDGWEKSALDLRNIFDN